MPRSDGGSHFAGYNNMTLHEVATHTAKVHTFSAGLSFIKWICGDSFTWNRRLMEHNILLYHELLSMEGAPV